MSANILHWMHIWWPIFKKFDRREFSVLWCNVFSICAIHIAPDSARTV